ncbi:helix-turn-helix transcriptional regulator [Halobaculum lipolyticum]|uniref:helix-turn-helix transcriptional regulator n=1 Tax=Halobaculum lipolyticum TaxID=3032001 RepID=UPI0024C2C659|nr:hypothetical protein [Halobaculum sp. DT31]
MRSPAAVAFALLLVLAGVAPAVAATAVPAGGPTGPAAPTAADSLAPDGRPAAPDLGLGFAQTGDVAADRVVLRATLRPDGDAEWRIAYRIELTDDNTTAAFESLQADVRENRSAYVSRFDSRMATTVAAAENATGREMAATNVSVTAQRNLFPTSTDYGVVAYTFTWEGFAATRGNSVVAGDALAGLFLDSGTVLTVAWPDGYEVRSVAPEADERSETAATWRGERTFGPDQPRVTVAPASALPLRPAYLAVAAVLLVGIGGAVLLRRRGDFPVGGDVLDRDGGASAAADGASGDEGAGGTGGADEPADRTRAADATADADGAAESPGDADADDDGAAADDDGDADDGDTAPPEELLSPHERVVRVVEGNGGRMKQADVTEELGWSAARTSQVVGDLRDDGTIESFRLGRENVLRLPEADDDPHPGDPDFPDPDDE